MNILHLTSKAAADRGDNVFIWRPTLLNNVIVLSIIVFPGYDCWGPDVWVLGWRVDKYLPMTHKSLYQWVDEVVQDIYIPRDSYTPLYSIFPVEVTRGVNMPLTHSIERAVDSKSGLPIPALSPDSLELLKPGSYGLFTPNGEASRDTFNFEPNYSIYRGKRAKSYGRNLIEESVISDELCSEVKARDGTKCRLTQTELPGSDIDITYIIPPWLAHLAMDHDNQMRQEMRYRSLICTPREVAETAMVSGNCLTMSKSAISLFEKSIITIDVDDNYRIIRFYRGDWVNSEIGQQLPEYFAPNGTEADIFLRAHFRYSLSVHAYGGDHQDTVPLITVQHFMSDMGLFEDNCMEFSSKDGDYSEDNCMEFSLKDDDYSTGEWNTYIGRQVLAWFQDRSYEPWGDTSLDEFEIEDN